VTQHKEQQGFLTFAKNSPDVNYLELAYVQCLNIKATQSHNSYAVVVDSATNQTMTDAQRQEFDYVIEYNSTGPFSAEPNAFRLTPFKETIKLESDLLFTRNIDHWWTAFRLKNICLSTGAKTYLGVPGTTRKYRELFDANEFPDVYNGLMYFRYSQEAANFFNQAQYLQDNWSTVCDQLKKCSEKTPSTDVLYGITALLVGPESCTMPSMDFLNFVHMKSEFNGWSDHRSWTETVVHERDQDIIRINNINQYDPVHYYDKTYVTQELVKYYESRRN
jgi:hypothetical protein